MTPAKDRRRGVLFMVLAVVVLSPDALLITVTGADVWTVVFWRGLLTALTLATALVFTHGREVVREGLRMGPFGILAGVFFGTSTLSFVMSVRLTAAANTLVIIAAMPLFAAVFTRLFLAEPVPPRTWVAITTGFAGIALLFGGSLSRGSVLGDLLALVTAILMASNFVIIRAHSRVSMLPAVVLSGVLTTLVTGFLCHPFSVETGDVLLLIVMGTVVLPIPLALMTVAPKLLPAPEVSLIMLLETFLGPFWVWLATGERPVPETVLGGGLLVATLVVHALAGRGDPGAPDPWQSCAGDDS